MIREREGHEGGHVMAKRVAKQTSREVVWFARANGIKRMGPYETQLEASAALIGPAGHPVGGAYVWPELNVRKRTP